MKNKQFDVLVVGGGHSGIEASSVAARMGSQVALITMDANKIGAMHCNPSVGGIGKGHLTFEISAFEGIMPKLCSKSYLQAKMLNTKKGPAVQGLRLQIDKIDYQDLAVKTIKNHKNIEIIEAEVVELLSCDSNGEKKIEGVVLKDGTKIFCKSVIITTGTFLNSEIYIGKKRCNPVKSLNPSSGALANSIEKLIEMKLGRLKTGTPPRLKKDTIDFSKLEYQKPHDLDYLFEFDPVKSVEKASCYITHTNAKTHQVIKDNMDKAGFTMLGGLDGALGPRYCPSLETKVARFPDKEKHHVFVEPESLHLDEVYPAGISTSMPEELQEKFIRTIHGFENAILVRPGFLIEYDFLQPTNLKHTLEHKQVKGLFLAGQINGTTGYEEAAAQGLAAGINAHNNSHGLEPYIFSRNTSYIGVMIDDLVSLGVNEPYRMFTSRAERRLILRQDNVFERLYPEAYKLGLVPEEKYNRFVKEKEFCDRSFALIKEGWRDSKLFKIFHNPNLDESLKEQATLELKNIFADGDWDWSGFSQRALINLHARTRYDGYLDREQLEIRKSKKYSDLKIPDSLKYQGIAGLSQEMIDRLTHLKPKNIAQAQLIPGITPAAISILIFRVRENEKQNKPDF